MHLKRIVRNLKPTYIKALYSDTRRAISRLTKRHRPLLILLGFLLILLFSLITNLQSQFRAERVRQEQIQSLQLELDESQQTHVKTQKELKVRKAEEAKLKAELDQLKLSKAQEKHSIVYAEPEPKVVVEAPSGCTGDTYADYIYYHESGCNPNRWNTSGCYGLGQSCPASKIAHCGADFDCQHAWFSEYALSRYGGWQGAYNFWINNNWW